MECGPSRKFVRVVFFLVRGTSVSRPYHGRSVSGLPSSHLSSPSFDVCCSLFGALHGERRFGVARRSGDPRLSDVRRFVALGKQSRLSGRISSGSSNWWFGAFRGDSRPLFVPSKTGSVYALLFARIRIIVREFCCRGLGFNTCSCDRCLVVKDLWFGVLMIVGLDACYVVFFSALLNRLHVLDEIAAQTFF